jgi:hypothetical protein
VPPCANLPHSNLSSAPRQPRITYPFHFCIEQPPDRRRALVHPRMTRRTERDCVVGMVGPTIPEPNNMVDIWHVKVR